MYILLTYRLLLVYLYILYYRYPNLLFLNCINTFYDFNYPINSIITLWHMDNLIIFTSDIANYWCIHFSMKIVQNISQIDSNSHLLKMCILNRKTWHHLLLFREQHIDDTFMTISTYKFLTTWPIMTWH